MGVCFGVKPWQALSFNTSKVLLAALFVNERFSLEKCCLQAVAVSVVERRRDKRRLVEEERIKQGFVRLAKGRPDPFLSHCPLLCLMVSGSSIGA